ncbi:cytochrome P450 [Hyaloraphidium curvatum]|nr:cytochrome P450 [Hyaloraphidium curvatum]
MQTWQLLLLGIFAYLAYRTLRLLASPVARLPGTVSSIFTNVRFLAAFLSGGFVPYNLALIRKFGPVVRVGPSEVLLGDAALAELATVKLDLPKPPAVFRMLRMPYLDDDSVFTFENKDRGADSGHRLRRRLVFPAFAPSALERVEPLVQDRVADLLLRISLDAGPKGDSPVELVDAFDAYTLDAILDLAFGLRPRSLLVPHSPEGRSADPLAPANIRRTVSRAFTYVGLRSALDSLGIDAGWLSFVPYVREGRAALDGMAEFTERVVAERRAGAGGGPKREDLLQALCDSADEKSGYRMTAREVVSEAALFLVAGQETTSSSLAFAAGFLMLHGARAWHRLRAELDAAHAALEPAPPVDANGFRRISHAALRDLPYLNAVLTETLRLRPIAAFIIRYTPQDLVLPDASGAEHPVPAGTMLEVASAAISTSPAFWGPDAERFAPERFLPPHLGGREGWKDPSSHETRKHLPTFSFGSRNCIGQALARMQLRLVLAHLVLNFDCDGWCGANRMGEGGFDSWAGQVYRPTMKVAGGKLYGELRRRGV